LLSARCDTPHIDSRNTQYHDHHQWRRRKFGAFHYTLNASGVERLIAAIPVRQHRPMTADGRVERVRGRLERLAEKRGAAPLCGQRRHAIAAGRIAKNHSAVNRRRSCDAGNIQRAAEILRSGGLVAFPPRPSTAWAATRPRSRRAAIFDAGAGRN
jgi:hypothetical protein